MPRNGNGYRARAKAVMRLIRNHEAEFKELLTQERSKYPDLTPNPTGSIDARIERYEKRIQELKAKKQEIPNH